MLSSSQPTHGFREDLTISNLGGEMQIKQTTVINQTGIHARPANDFVKKASEFESNITIQNLDKEGSKPVNAKSIVRLLVAGLGKGTKVELTAEGPDEVEAIETLVAMIDSGFGEAEG